MKLATPAGQRPSQPQRTRRRYIFAFQYSFVHDNNTNQKRVRDKFHLFMIFVFNNKKIVYQLVVSINQSKN